ncbi:MAG: hypothetical protein MPK11_04875 [Gammaproteobacteria bacterium]|nr:hypothetical protein [Gammaproteobacteria bacterium]MDA7961677.1 hypothetical protein [Gammaproteobacteria bacterium]MDA7970091.1 hypothetical protein [Gammaproteobacteria bacterium]MDA7971722.1 hypothetical protein [Gammaproteobacteria bacterium]MDA7995841.1 hypothetical protein [Gammaproteobacteria bacterium]
MLFAALRRFAAARFFGFGFAFGFAFVFVAAGILCAPTRRESHERGKRE